MHFALHNNFIGFSWSSVKYGIKSHTRIISLNSKLLLNFYYANKRTENVKYQYKVFEINFIFDSVKKLDVK